MSKLKGDLAPKSNKTPYELRLEILYLAQSIVDRRTENELQLIHLQSEPEKYANLTDLLGEDISEFENSSVDEVLKIAKRLNQFVSHG
tara:strand:- start:250 stop:513 length:264 start_codon:yes stop_codon:yes gene_type:complete